MVRRYDAENVSAGESDHSPAGSRGVLVVSAVATLVGVGGAAMSLSALEQTSREGPGPGLVPTGVLSALALCGVVCALREYLLLRRYSSAGEVDRAAGESAAADTESSLTWSRPVVVAGLLGLYLLAIPWLGFLAATFAFSTGTLVVVGHRWLRALVEAAGVAVGAWALFVWLLALPLPDWVRL